MSLLPVSTRLSSAGFGNVEVVEDVEEEVEEEGVVAVLFDGNMSISALCNNSSSSSLVCLASTLSLMSRYFTDAGRFSNICRKPTTFNQQGQARSSQVKSDQGEAIPSTFNELSAIFKWTKLIALFSVSLIIEAPLLPMLFPLMSRLTPADVLNDLMLSSILAMRPGVREQSERRRLVQ